MAEGANQAGLEHRPSTTPLVYTSCDRPCRGTCWLKAATRAHGQLAAFPVHLACLASTRSARGPCCFYLCGPTSCSGAAAADAMRATSRQSQTRLELSASRETLSA
eukprot:6172231-Pleurochrysis_carterae.AAC.1